jgi:CBS domain-containing protein
MSVLEVAHLMALRKLKRLPVVDPLGHLLGIISRVDLLQAIAGQSEQS